MKSSTKKVLPFVIGLIILVVLIVFAVLMIKAAGKKAQTKDTGIVLENGQTLLEDEDLQKAEISDDENAILEASDDNTKEAYKAVDDNNDSFSLVKEETSEDALDSSETDEAAETPEADPQQDAESASDSDEENAAGEESSAEQGDIAGEEASTEEGATPERLDAAEAAAEIAKTPHTGGHLVVIDPGHQSKAMTDKEPNGPGSSDMKMKVTAGTTGKTTGLSETQLNLTIGLMLRDELQNRGYTVMMTRETNDVSISNIDRAQFANSAGAEAFIRIHANGSDNTSTNGALTICQTPSNPYNGNMYAQSRKLSDCVLDAYVASTGFKKQYVWETDTMTGINWANVPSTIIEMGYMSNPTDDVNMSNPDYQRLMTIGIANGIDNYFAQ